MGLLRLLPPGKTNGPDPENDLVIVPRLTGADLPAVIVSETPSNVNVIEFPPVPNVIVFPDALQLPMM
jgi:hypothetical protein